MAKFRNFCFTINNWTDDDVVRLNGLDYKYLIYAPEVGKQGTPHLQGYCELAQQTRCKALKSKIPKAHIEKRKGTPKQAADYCKKDGDYTEHGEISRPGARNDIKSYVSSILEGKSEMDIIEEHPSCYVRYPKAYHAVKLAQARQDKSFRKVQVIILHGPAGSGKTRRAYQADPDLYAVTDSRWWDGYCGQKTILIDDFYGGIRYDYFLRLLDGYPFQLPIKGGFTWKQWDTVYITSNSPPALWYPVGYTDAIARRVSQVEELVLPSTSETNTSETTFPLLQPDGP